jgi:tetratricopeptide (TPR) repeat protein
MAIIFMSISHIALAEISIETLGTSWSEANYALEGDAQESAFEELVKQADQYVSDNSDDAKGWIWRGIIKSSFAGAKGGLGALSLVKAAKADLDQAISIDENSLSGSAHASLGMLYAKVPGWPFGFGSDKQAEKHLVKALKINPDGVDSNYFYGEFLFEETRRYKEAKKYLLKAQISDPVKITPLADEARQKEITALLLKVEKKIKRKKRH